MSDSPPHPLENTTYDNSADAPSDHTAAHTAPIDDTSYPVIGFLFH